MSNEYEAPRAQPGASRKGDLFYLVPLDPAYMAGLAGHLPVKVQNWILKRVQIDILVMPNLFRHLIWPLDLI
jgi:hypothetical protein